jgi:hypothetical protein
MIKRSRTTMAAALLTAAALAATSTPSFALSKQYCRDYAADVASRGDRSVEPLALVVPLAVLGAGVGAIAGVAISGLAIGTGAAVGGGSGAIAGAAASTHDRDSRRAYERAYAECRAR